VLNPTRVQAATVIRRSPQEVWALLFDPNAWRAMLPQRARIELLTDSTSQIGSRWKSISGDGTETLNEVTELVPYRLHVVRSTSRKTVNTVTTTLEPQDDGVLVRVASEIHWRPGLGTLVDRIGAALTANALSARATERLKAIAEADSD
jgi:uncharacterized protein YndB with AHSA1/START domain